MAHIRECSACRAKLAELQFFGQRLGEAGRRLPNVETPASVRRRWMTTIRGASTESSGAPGTTTSDSPLVFGWLTGRRLAWGSLAAMWTLVCFLRFTGPDASKPASFAGTGPVSLREVIVALKVEPPPAQFPADAQKPVHFPRSSSDASPPRSQGSPAVDRAAVGRDWEAV